MDYAERARQQQIEKNKKLAALRDWFAGMVLMGAHASMASPATGLMQGDPRGLAEDCYQIADAMLAARPGDGTE